jgi:hypothetical protein
VVKFVRDPFERVVSSFVHASRRGYEDEGLFKFLGRPVDAVQRFSFREFVAYLETLNLDRCDAHHRYQIHPLERDQLVRPAHLIKLEQSGESLPALEHELGLRRTDLHVVGTAHHHTTRVDAGTFCGDERFVLGPEPGVVPQTRWFYDAQLRSKVAELYDVDFEAYGYAKAVA